MISSHVGTELTESEDDETDVKAELRMKKEKPSIRLAMRKNPILIKIVTRNMNQNLMMNQRKNSIRKQYPVK